MNKLLFTSLFYADKKVDLQCCSFFEDGTKLKIFFEIYLSLTAMNWLYGRMNRFHLPWTKVQPKFERKCRPSIIILVWSNTYSALECKFHSSWIFFLTFGYLFYFFKGFVILQKFLKYFLWLRSFQITKTALSDKVSSTSVLEKAGLWPLNEMVASQTALMVWKSNKAKDPLGRFLFPKRSIMRPTRSINCVKAIQPVPGNNTLAANLMARAWNSSSELQTATTIGAARTVAQKWARNLLLWP